VGSTKLSHQVNVRLSPSAYEKIKHLARAEHRDSMGEVVRVLIDWILPQIGEFGTLASLSAIAPGKRYSRRVSADLQDQLHSAIDLIFEHAPSAIIQDVAEYLTKRAGKYGDEK
jgi:hypothetical protein